MSTMKSQRAELLAIAEKGDTEALVQFVKNAKQQSRDLADLVAEYSRRQHEDLWEALRHACSEALFNHSAEEGEDADKKRADQYAFLDCLVTLATATVHQDLPQAFQDTAVLLHGVLLRLPEELDPVRHRLAQLFESWWRQNVPGREDVIPNTFLYFLKRSLAKNMVSDVKAVCRLHQVLTLVNLEAASASELRHLLGRCCSAPGYLRNEEGRRFLSYIFTLNCRLVDALHKCIKNHIPFAPKSWSAVYGDIYFRAWQKSSGEIRQKIENDCIQDLMNHAIHASREGAQPMSSTLFRVMHQFHRQKKQRGVDGMLLRLYSPLLWRALAVPNTEVRANSAGLLLDAFPLQDQHSNTVEENDQLVQKQFDLLQRLLADCCPVVRALAVEGVCGLLSDYLEMIPGEVVQNLLLKLLTQLAFDTASPAVRVAVVKGVGIMLDNPLFHCLLKPLLPNLAKGLHDRSEAVRVAMVDLLLKVKGIHSLKYWAIGPVEDLLACLERDSQPVVRRVVELLCPSFLPLTAPPQEQVRRCLTLLQANPSAARVFFLSAPRHLTLSDTVKHMALLCRYVLESVRCMNNRSLNESNSSGSNSSGSNSGSNSSSNNSAGQRGGKKRRGDREQDEADDESEEEEDDDDNEDNDNDDSDNVLTQEMLQGLLEAIFLMWTAVAKQLDMAEHRDLKQSIMKKLSVTVPEVLKVTQDPKVISLVVEIAGHLPPKAVPTISRGCLSKLGHMGEDCGEGDWRELLEAVCLWDMAPQLLQRMAHWLEDSLTPTHPAARASAPPEKKRGKERKKCVQISVPEEEKRPGLALQYLQTMLTSPVCKHALLHHHRPQLLSINSRLSCVTQLVEIELEQGGVDNSERRAFLQTVLSLHLRLTVILHDPEEGGGDAVMRMKQLMEWEAKTLVPIMQQAKNGAEDASAYDKAGAARQENVDFATDCVLLTLTISSNMLMLGMGDREHVVLLLTFGTHLLLLLHHNVGLAVVDQVLGCLHQAVLFEELGVEEGEGEEVSRCMAQICAALNRCMRQPHPRSVHTELLGDVKVKIQGVTTCLTSRHGNPRTAQPKSEGILVGLTSTLLTAALTELQHSSEQDTLPTKLENASEIVTPISACVLTCYSRNSSCSRVLMKAMEKWAGSGSFASIHSVHALVHLLLAVHSKASFQKNVALNPVVTAVGDLVQRLDQHAVSLEEEVEEDVYKDTVVKIQSKLQSIVGNAC